MTLINENRMSINIIMFVYKLELIFFFFECESSGSKYVHKLTAQDCDTKVKF